MTYLSWYETHAARHKALMKKLLAKKMSKSEIIAYFDFENMVTQEPDFCPLYKEKNDNGVVGKKCHDMEQLNCYLCACPYFRFNDEGIKQVGEKTLYRGCSIVSKGGKESISENAIHQDCSNCTIPHHVVYIRKRYDEEWKKMMNKCKTKPAITNS